MKLADIAQHIGGKVHGDGSCEITKFATLEKAQKGDISFLANNHYRELLKQTQASAVILSADDLALCPTHAIVMDQPYMGYSRAANLIAPNNPVRKGIHPTAVIAPSAKIDKSAWIGPCCVIEDDVIIEASVQINACSVVQQGCYLGAQSQILANVTLCHGTRIGERTLIHPGAVIGADGFSLANEKGIWKKIPQTGKVYIGADVEIGANTTIDRGSLDDTIIGDGVKMDNQVHIAHNVVIGDHCAIAGCTGIAGSTKIGKHCSISGGVGVLGHVEITDNVVITAMTFVSKSITTAGTYSSGSPLQTNKKWRRNVVRMKYLDQLTKRIAALERQIQSKKG